MRRRLISICIIGIIVYSICGCAQTAEDAPIAEMENVEPENTEIEDEEATDAEKAEKIASEEEHGQDEIENESVADVSEQEEQTKAAQRQWKVYIQPDMPAPFIEVLKLYEEFMNSDRPEPNNDDAWNELWDEFQKVDGKWWYLSDEFCGTLMSRLDVSVKEGEEEAFRYSLMDLTGDGFPELIMGYYSDLFDEDYLYAVYYYSEMEGIKMEWHTSYFSMSLYEGGIIEYISAGAYGSITYLQFQKETESWEEIDCIIEHRNQQSDGDKYYRGVNLADFSDPENEPMSKEEYREIVERYTAKPVELEWTPMFCGETPDEKADSKNDEPVTVIAKVTHYFADESDIYWTEYEYDSLGKLTRQTQYNADGSVGDWYEYEYDSAGNETKYIKYSADGSVDWLYEYEYDSTGNETKYIKYSADGSVNGWYEYEYEYDSEGNLIKQTRYDADSRARWWYEYEYGSEGNKTKEISYDGNGSINGWLEWEYDSTGNLTRRALYNADGIKYGEQTEYEYNNAGKQTEFTSYDTDGNVVDRYEYKYDSKGNLTEELNCGNNGSTYFRTEYEYDSAGNLTKMTEYYLSHRIEYEYITITSQ